MSHHMTTEPQFDPQTKGNQLYVIQEKQLSETYYSNKLFSFWIFRKVIYI